MTVQTFTRRGALALALALACLGLALPASLVQAQSDKPIRVVVPLSAGSTVDAVARAMSNQMAKVMGHSVAIENLPGAGGMTGTVQIVNAPKDGLTLGMISSNHVINPSIYKKVPFDTLKDIAPITVIGTVPLVLVVHPSVKANSTRELVAQMKASPGALTLGSAGNGSTLHLAGVMFGSEAGVEIRHIPYKGTGPLTSDIVGGQVDMAFISVTAAAPHIKSGKLRALGLSTKTRSPVLPDVPTLAESGLPNYSFDAWIALVGPAGLPAPMVQKAYGDIKTVLAHKEVQDALAQQGINLINNTPEQAVPFFKSELEKHARLVRQSGATAE